MATVRDIGRIRVNTAAWNWIKLGLGLETYQDIPTVSIWIISILYILGYHGKSCSTWTSSTFLIEISCDTTSCVNNDYYNTCIAYMSNLCSF